MTVPQRAEAMFKKAKSEDHESLGVKFCKDFLNSMKALTENKVAVWSEPAPQNIGLKPPKECFGCHPD